MSAPTLITTPVVRFMVDELIRRGKDPAPLYRRFGVEQERLELPLRHVEAFSDDCAELAEDPLFGVTVAHALPRGAYGPAEFLWRSAATMEDGWLLMRRYERFVSEIFAPTLRPLDGGLMRLAFAMPVGCTTIGRHSHEYIVTVCARLLREMSGNVMKPLRFGLVHRAHAHRAALEEALGAPVVFSQQDNWLELERAGLRAPVVSADAALNGVLTRLLDRLAESLARPGSFLEQVRGVIDAQLQSGNFRIARVAKALKLSERTLQRRLGDEGTHLRALVEDVRHHRALMLVKSTQTPLSEVSWSLGFSEFSAFSRAFKRWTGSTPGALRRAQQDPSAHSSAGSR